MSEMQVSFVNEALGLWAISLLLLKISNLVGLGLATLKWINQQNRGKIDADVWAGFTPCRSVLICCKNSEFYYRG
jgi:hypothetical protein